MTDERLPEVGWLHYRLAVAVCSAFVTGIMLLLVPLIVSISTATPELFVIYKFVFSKWGAAALLGSAVIGFLVGGERMANFFAIIWGTHPFWSKLEGGLYELGDWLDDHKTVGAFLAIAIGLLVVGVFWYISLATSNSAPNRDGREAAHADQSSSAPARGRER